MLGYQLTFFTQQDRIHKGCSLANWLMAEAKNIGIGGATLISATKGFGRDRKLRSVQPLHVTMAVCESDAERFFTRIKEEGINVFYVKPPIEFGLTGRLRSARRAE